MSNPPVFVLGVERSGTTLLALMLDTHSEIAIPYESHFIPEYFKMLTAKGELNNIKNKKELVRDIYNEPYLKEWDFKPEINSLNLEGICAFQDIIEEIYYGYAKHFGKKIWGDKTPAYVFDIPILNMLFPAAKYIHLIRGGRDVALSLMRMRWGANDFISAISYWRETVFWTRKILSMLPEDRFIELKFENIILNPEKELRKITTFLGVGYENTMLDYSKKATDKVGRKRMAAHHKYLCEAPSISQTLKWKNALGGADQAIAYEIAGKVLVDIGYLSGKKRHHMKIPRKIFHRCKESYNWRVGRFSRKGNHGNNGCIPIFGKES